MTSFQKIGLNTTPGIQVLQKLQLQHLSVEDAGSGEELHRNVLGGSITTFCS